MHIRGKYPSNSYQYSYPYSFVLESSLCISYIECKMFVGKYEISGSKPPHCQPMYDKEIFYLVEKLKPLFRDFVGNGDVWTHLFRIFLVLWTYIFSGIFYFKMSKSAFRSVIHATFSQKLAGNFKNKKAQYFPLFL